MQFSSQFAKLLAESGFHLLPPSLLGCFQFKDILEHPRHLHFTTVLIVGILIGMVFHKKADVLFKVNKSLLLALLWPLSLIHLVRASRSQNMFCRLPTFCHRRHISKTPFHSFHFHHFCQHQECFLKYHL